MGAPIPIDTYYNLTDVFDLLVYVLLRSMEALPYFPDADAAGDAAH